MYDIVSHIVFAPFRVNHTPKLDTRVRLSMRLRELNICQVQYPGMCEKKKDNNNLDACFLFLFCCCCYRCCCCFVFQVRPNIVSHSEITNIKITSQLCQVLSYIRASLFKTVINYDHPNMAYQRYF